MYKYCERIKPVQSPIQRVPVWCEGMTAHSDLHSGVAALNVSRCGRAGPLQLFEFRLYGKIGVVPRVTSPPDSSFAVRGLLFFRKRGNSMKKLTGYLCLSLTVFLVPLLCLYIGFIRAADNNIGFPFIRMTICTLISLAFTSLFTRYIHPITGLAGLDSAKLNLGFTVALVLSVFVQYVTFGGENVGAYLDALTGRNEGNAGGSFYRYISYVFMGGHIIIAVRTFIHSAFLGLLKAVMKHAK